MIPTGRIYILNVTSREWKEGPQASVTRIACACALVGTQFVVWGGLREFDYFIPGPPTIYDLELNQWVTKYTPPSDPPPPPPPPPPNSSLAGILAGSIGGSLVVALCGVFFYYKKTKADPQSSAGSPEDGTQSEKPGPQAYQECLRSPQVH